MIEPALRAGRHVLCDRFTDSTRAYQGYGRGVPLAAIDQVDLLATGGRRPDHTLLFDLPARGRPRPRPLPLPPGARRRRPDRLRGPRLLRPGAPGVPGDGRGGPARFQVLDSAGPVEATERRMRRILKGLLGEPGLEVKDA